MQTVITSTTKVKVTKKGAVHAPRASAMGNHLNWQATLAVKGVATNGATVGELVAAIQKANQNNQGNALPYIKYQVRNGNLALVA